MLIAQQNIEFEKSNFPDNKKELKQALKDISAADQFLNSQYPEYKSALDLYLKANNLNPNNANLNFKIGYCYLKTNKIDNSIKHLEKSKNLKTNIDSINFIIAQAYHISYEFDRAIDLFKSYKNSLSPEMAKKMDKRIDKFISECETGKELYNNPVRVFIDNIGPKINTKYPEYGPKISADGSEMYFTSRRPTENDDVNAPLESYLENIFKSERKNGEWQSAVKMDKRINSAFHNAIVGLAADGQKIIIYRGDNGGDIYVSELEGDEWSKAESFSKKINTSYHDADGSFSFDYLKLYFVSDKPGGFGGHDIYISELGLKGKWSDPENIGPVINTEYDERGIFALPDGKTFYFSSNGHNTMGGYDIFKTTFENGKWTKPVNLGYPINTTGDDLYFTLSTNGVTGFYSSSLNKDSYGSHDIYQITFRGLHMNTVNSNEDNLLAISDAASSIELSEPELEIETTNVTLLKGFITDEFTSEPLFAEIELTDLETNKIIATFKSNKSTGKYLVTLPSGKNYGISVKAEDCLFHSENIDIKDANTQFQEIEKNIQLKKIVVGSQVTMKNIFFDSGKSTLRDESKSELQNLIDLMNEIPSLKIEISGHTDNVGSKSNNQKLSENRAKAVVDYLVEKGISVERLTYKGYGQEKPIADNSTAEGRQQNRRTMFEVLSR